MHEPKRVPLENDDDIVRVVRSMIDDGTPRLLEHNGTAIAVLLSPHDFANLKAPKAEDPWTNYDPRRARASLVRGTAALLAVDGDELKRDIRADRGQDSTGRSA